RLACLPLYRWLLFEWNDRPLAALLLGFLGITDWVDGYVARRFDQRSDFGAVFDPVVDRLLFLVGTGAALVDGALPAWLAVLVLSREVLVGGAMAVATAFGMERFPVTTMGKRYTFLLMVGIPLLILSAGDHPTSELAGAVGWVCVVPGLVLSYVTGVLYVPKIRAALVSGRLKRGLP
ncbi:MAG: CDP-diacylglycerol--glycerol-3-phosphate 3-phosphatidyltransferase, partial [Actinomycetota bacterium]